jgi:hypothetical protein
VLSCAQVAKRAKLSVVMLWRLIEEGRVPFAEKVGARWLLDERSVEFLNTHYQPEQRKASRWVKGQAMRDAMKQAAAELDPACLTRQRKTVPQYHKRRKKSA